MRKPVIVVKTNAGTRQMLLTGEPVTIGRDTANSLAYVDHKLSRFHCKIEPQGDEFKVQDLGSTNGTKVNGDSIEQATLRSGDVITLGQITIQFLLVDEGKLKGRMGPHPHPQDSALAAPSLATPAQPNPHAAAPDAASGQATNFADDEPQAPPPHRGPQFAVSTSTRPAEPAESVVTDGNEPAEEILDFANAHNEILQQTITQLAPGAFDASAVGLINSRRQTVHAPIDEDVAAAVKGGRDSVLFLRTLLCLCVHIRATDLHIEPKSDEFQVRLRVDGMMVSVLQMHSKIATRLLRLVKVMADIDIAQNNIVQEGHFCSTIPGRRIDYRVSFTPAMYGQKLVLRVLDLASAPTHLKDLGLASWMERDIARVIRQDSGMVLMCGPTGSGKTTTLYALIREIDVTLRNVITIEDPVEYQVDGVTQIPINEAHGRSFSSLLRSVLRQDPDVLLVGEVRDTETANIAMQASITGHLVLSTVHAQDAIGTIFRLLDLGVERYLIASGLHLVLAQRLIRQLCPYCRKACPLSSAQLVRLSKFGISNVHATYTPIGCSRCLETGFIGRRAIFELLTTTEELRDIIQSGSQIQDVRKAVRATLFTSLLESGYRMVGEGRTTIEEIERVVGTD